MACRKDLFEAHQSINLCSHYSLPVLTERSFFFPSPQTADFIFYTSGWKWFGFYIVFPPSSSVASSFSITQGVQSVGFFGLGRLPTSVWSSAANCTGRLRSAQKTRFQLFKRVRGHLCGLSAVAAAFTGNGFKNNGFKWLKLKIYDFR